ncbi:MAG: DivIVA domain-containing protein, partial [Gemmatimonas sp.]
MTDDAFHLTALDARRYDFGNALRGYDRARVDQFRDQVAEELERLSRANQELEVKARNFHEQLRAFRERDKALNDALISAQQLRGEIREQAQREAQLIIREAQGDAERSLDVLRSEIRRAEDELQQLWRNRRSFVQQLRQLTERQLHDLESAEMVSPPAGIANADSARETPAEVMQRMPQPEVVQRAPQPEIAQRAPQSDSVPRARQPEIVTRSSQPEFVQRAPQPEIVTRALQPEIAARATQPELVQRSAQPWAR